MGTRCSGDAQGELEQIPAFSMTRNSSSVMLCLYGSNRLGAGEHGGGATCVDVVDHPVERLGLRGGGPQQGREFLEQLLYLGREGGDSGGGL